LEIVHGLASPGANSFAGKLEAQAKGTYAPAREQELLCSAFDGIARARCVHTCEPGWGEFVCNKLPPHC
jgi:hypothetical protein